jgi:hypothetical protein
VRIFFIFWTSKIRVRPTGVVSSISPPRCRISFGRRRYAAASCHTSFSLRQDELAVFASFFDNASSRRLPSRIEIEALNKHHCHRSTSSDCPTPTLYYYKKIISTLITFSTTKSRFYFTSSLPRSPRHQNSTHRCRSQSPLSHVHRPST